MTAYAGSLVCVFCGTSYAEPATQLIGAGCPQCPGANVLPAYDLRGLGNLPVDRSQPGIFRYRELLPLSGEVTPVSLGEGNTPVVSLPGPQRVWIKDESRNPTWSYKDRLAAVAMTKAVESGAGTVVVASTGNHGAAVAAYAARAGLRCVVLTLASVPTTMKTLMQAYGAEVVALPKPADRWHLMRELVRERGWMAMSGYADPPAGSHPYGVDGYKTIAYELIEQLPVTPDVVVVPVAYGDGLSGIARGFADLATLGVIERVPRLIAAEPFGPLADALARGADSAGPVPVGPSVAFSTASPFGTRQSLAALRGSNGAAIATPDNDEILAAQLELASSAGIYLEASSVTAVVALRKAGLAPDETAVVIGTSTGLKDVGATASVLPPVPVIEPSIVALDKVLR
ncbi:pyridoxal-phosphate dependent enzyme [Actinoplanes bogorensis]|uniref:Pyridoxal-phosphate dependent enzyme n=1 Tax=Paractinoplanes bogorensis TaxID=1610840 RepID=A0ABS5YMT5_9ACTN|nr:pyridoxal-phosphate dependent enzyme [Actinoplanes bogorensis]MBU2664780.1 pyridoxal-phosphate dependent enzyme [Actinoplanes bogorensis]